MRGLAVTAASCGAEEVTDSKMKTSANLRRALAEARIRTRASFALVRGQRKITSALDDHGRDRSLAIELLKETQSLLASERQSRNKLSKELLGSIKTGLPGRIASHRAAFLQFLR